MRVRTGVTGIALAALAATVISSGAEAAGGRVRVVDMRDRCDPETFAFVPGGCTDHPGGETTFEEFVEELHATGSVDGWRFNPDETTIRTSEWIQALNRGGEVHTFTPVPYFGPGCVPEVNELMGFDPAEPPVVDCETEFEPELIAQGQKGAAISLTKGTHKFMCLIHPWMTTVVKVRRS